MQNLFKSFFFIFYKNGSSLNSKKSDRIELNTLGLQIFPEQDRVEIVKGHI